MRRAALLTLLSVFSLSGCNNNAGVVVVQDGPPAPRALSASYYAGAVTVEWELAPNWDGETFRVYSRRVTDSNYFFIAEVTSCSDGLCSYQDRNVVADETYDYYVTAVDQGSGLETASDDTVEVYVPVATPPPVPTGPYVIALDGANYITWDANARSAGRLLVLPRLPGRRRTDRTCWATPTPRASSTSSRRTAARTPTS